MKRILFQGDSITDCIRLREDDTCSGHGYATVVSAKLGFEFPGKYEFINKGVSGDRIVDVYARIKRDIINLKPDYMSLLIGVNDVWHEISESKNGVAAEKFEKIYDMLITEVKEALPNIKIMLLGAYVTKGAATEEHWSEFSSEVAKRAEAARKIAEKHNLVYVPLQEKFDEMMGIYPEPYWTKEGVHPTNAGHGLIANEWVKGFEKLIEE